MANDLEIEKSVVSALVNILGNRVEPPTRTDIKTIAKIVAPISGWHGALEGIVGQVMATIDTRMGQGTSLVDPAATHDVEWVGKRDDITWTYAEAYEKFLRDEGWPPRLVQSLSDVTTRILGHLQDPTSDGSWDRRGLVIGHVQSGKTANYTGLVGKAADAGYKFIIVVAGIHNNLRKQTQERLDEAFIGRSSDPQDRKLIGVGLNAGYPHPATLTNILNDFNKKTANDSGWKLNDFSKPIVLVIKKNTSTLTALHTWLKDLNAVGDQQISDVPMLFIDDEADNASINTNKEDLDPTKINSLIRRILRLFAKSNYVGYTATPFANILINPDAYDDEIRDELFPRDFIYCLDAPNTYFGAEKVFLNDESSKSILRPINDAEDFLSFSHKREDSVVELPPSLYRALDTFLVARAIRNQRGHSNKHCSMMINVSRFVPIQKAVRDFLSLREKYIREAVLANYMMPESVSSQNTYMQDLKIAYLAEYSDVGMTWEQVKVELNSVFDHIHLYVINSKSDEVLDFKKYEKAGVGLTAVAIGGLSLSRGLTVEGLTVSYMYRNTKMYDTLMQMGRWFGYRPNYEDLCRVHLSNGSISWYSYIAEASEELIQQVKRMRRDNLRPKDFGLYVLSHPDRQLVVTAASKMRSGEEVLLEQSFSGQLKESYIASTDRSVNIKNFALIDELWRNNFNAKKVEATKKGFVFNDVPIAVIESFLKRFDAHSSHNNKKNEALNYLKLVADLHPFGDVLIISPPTGAGSEQPFTMRVQERTVGMYDSDSKSWHLTKNRVASRGDERLGLSEDQLRAAERKAAEDNASSSVADTYYRAERKKPLLMLHSLQPKNTEEFIGPIAAYGISFPYGDYLRTIKAVANKVWLQQMQETSDDPDDEEDYDD